MDSKYLKHPATIALMVSALLMIIGGLMSWLTLPASVSAMVGSLADDLKNTLATKQHITIGVGIIALVVGFFAARKGSKGLSVLNLVLSLVGFVSVITAFVDKDTLSQLGVDGMGAGFYLALLGVLALFVTSVITLFVYKKQKPVMPAATV